MNYVIMKVLGILILVTAAVHGEIRISLNSDSVKWTVYNSNKSINIGAAVPGGIYTDLQRAGLISENLFYRFNDIEYRWVARESWTYGMQFNVSSDVLNKRVVNLVLHGIDTIASVHLNGHIIKSAKNMFVRYVIPVKELLNENNNTLEINFKSPILEAKKLFDSHNYTVPPRRIPSHYNGESHVNFLRKMQASFAWDWGPAFPSMGLWKPVEIEAFDDALIRDVTFKAEAFNNTMWKVIGTVYIESAQENYISEVIGTLSTENGALNLSSYETSHENGETITKIRAFIPKTAVKLWWPNGYGDQNTYILNVFISNISETSERSVMVGFRTVDLVQERIRPTKEGLTFFFRINGMPIFAKGSNWIPSHILPELSYDEKRIYSLLLSAKEAHMNILRIWGGGLYESDFFYQTATKLGIMIWQDMMYACAMYPTDSKFLENVKTETVQQVRRLQHHPSIILWAGNNENEAALRGNWYGTSRDFRLYKSDYIKLYVDTVKPAVLKNDDSRPFTVSSPSNGIMSEKEGYIASDPYSPLYGDTHFYNYILDSWNSITYPYTRFASEYGFQSLPSFKTMADVSLPKDRKIESEFSAKRQHLLAGYFLIALQIKLRLPLPKKTDMEEYYKNFIYSSQVSQAMGIKTETEKYRRDRNRLTKNNEGRTMGAMYWQLNDVWQAPTWSSIDFNGRWKMLHYFAKKFFSPVLVSPDLTIDKHMNIIIISDLMYDIPEAEMNISIYSWDDFEPKKVITTKERIHNSRAKIHGRYDLPELLKEVGCNMTNSFIYITLTAAKAGLNIDNFLFPISFSKVTNLQPAKISVEVSQKEDIIVQLKTDQIAPFVWLETDEIGQFSDNGFLLLHPTKRITFGNRNETVNFERFRESLTVRSLLS